MSEASEPHGYEPSDADPRLLGAIAGGIAAFVIVVPFLLLGLFPGSATRGGIERGLQPPPQPRLQVNARADLAASREREARMLESYGWIDRSRGAVHVPIERAMELVLQRGLPGWASTETPK